MICSFCNFSNAKRHRVFPTPVRPPIMHTLGAGTSVNTCGADGSSFGCFTRLLPLFALFFRIFLGWFLLLSAIFETSTKSSSSNPKSSPPPPPPPPNSPPFPSPFPPFNNLSSTFRGSPHRLNIHVRNALYPPFTTRTNSTSSFPNRSPNNHPSESDRIPPLQQCTYTRIFFLSLFIFLFKSTSVCAFTINCSHFSLTNSMPLAIAAFLPLLANKVPTTFLSSSSNNATFTAFGMCPFRNSLGDLASMSTVSIGNSRQSRAAETTSVLECWFSREMEAMKVSITIVFSSSLGFSFLPFVIKFTNNSPALDDDDFLDDDNTTDGAVVVVVAAVRSSSSSSSSFSLVMSSLSLR
mmetsp:Transcript_265/g.820  ORF Transcript_265/g.820 Transcript_265/m.820 type:complete len:352 (-) Transcript_265:71-1126(-)